MREVAYIAIRKFLDENMKDGELTIKDFAIWKRN